VFSYLSDNAPPPSADAVEGYWAEVLYCFTTLLLYCFTAICRTTRRRRQRTPSKAIGLRSFTALLLYCFTALLLFYLSDNAPPPSADAVEGYWAEVHARSPRAQLYFFTSLLLYCAAYSALLCFTA
jgi:amino acid transporter